MRQREAGFAQYSSRLARVVHVDNVDAKISLQPHDVAVCTMKHLQKKTTTPKLLFSNFLFFNSNFA
jgi:hypothetical protein